MRWYLLIFLFCPILAVAAPTISTVSTPTIGQAVTITGAGFGSGPTIQVFDDFDNGVVGQSISTTAVVGSWTGSGYLGRSLPITDSTHARAGGKAARTTNGSTFESWRQAHKEFPATTEVFMSYWVRVADGTHFPYATTPNTFPARSSWKFTWLTQGSDTGENDICVPSHANQGWIVVGGNDYTPNSPYVQLGTSWWDWSGWMRLSGWLKAAPSPTEPGTFYVQYLGLNHSQGTFSTQAVFDVDGAGDKNWTAFRFPGNYELNAAGTYSILYDDVYLATGANAAARVEFCNAASYTSSTRCTIATPTSWDNTIINATFQQGDFSAGTDVYAYVVDATNTPNATGYGPLTISGEPPPPDTAAPTCSAFSLQSPVTTLTVPVTALECTDNVGVTGYYWGESPNPPGGSGWSSIPPSAITVGGLGSRTIYVWARDAADNRSVARTATVQVDEAPTGPVSGGMRMGISGRVPISSAGQGRLRFQ